MVGAQGQAKWAKVATYDVTYKKNALPSKKIFLECRLEDLPHLLRLLLGL